MKNDNRNEVYKQLEKPKTLDELLKGGLKKGQFVELFSCTGKGVSIATKCGNNS